MTTWYDCIVFEGDVADLSQWYVDNEVFKKYSILCSNQGLWF